MATAKQDTDMHRAFDEITHPAVKTIRTDRATFRVQWGDVATFVVYESPFVDGTLVSYLRTSEIVAALYADDRPETLAYAVYGAIAAEVGRPR